MLNIADLNVTLDSLEIQNDKDYKDFSKRLYERTITPSLKQKINPSSKLKITSSIRENFTPSSKIDTLSKNFKYCL